MVALLAVAVYADIAFKPDSTGEQGSGLGEGSGRGLQLQVSCNTNPTNTLIINYLLVGNQYNFLSTRMCQLAQVRNFLLQMELISSADNYVRLNYILPNEP